MQLDRGAGGNPNLWLGLLMADACWRRCSRNSPPRRLKPKGWCIVAPFGGLFASLVGAVCRPAHAQCWSGLAALTTLVAELRRRR